MVVVCKYMVLKQKHEGGKKHMYEVDIFILYHHIVS